MKATTTQTTRDNVSQQWIKKVRGVWWCEPGDYEKKADWCVKHDVNLVIYFLSVGGFGPGCCQYVSFGEFEEAARLCRERSIRIVPYTLLNSVDTDSFKAKHDRFLQDDTAGLLARLRQNIHEWTAKDLQGQETLVCPFWVPQGRCSMCFSSGYMDFYADYVKNLVTRGADGVWLDIWARPDCYCPRCREIYQTDLNRPLQECKHDSATETDYRFWMDKFLVAMLRKLKPEMRAIKSDSIIALENCASFGSQELFNLVDVVNAELMAGPKVGGVTEKADWPIMLLNWVDLTRVARYVRLMSNNKMYWSCRSAVELCPDILTYDAAACYSSGGAHVPFDSIWSGNYGEMVFKDWNVYVKGESAQRIKQDNRFIKRVESLLAGLRIKADIAIAVQPDHRDKTMPEEDRRRHRAEASVFYRLCRETHWPAVEFTLPGCRTFPESASAVEDLCFGPDRVKLMILPHPVNLEAGQLDFIKRYWASGGTVLLSGNPHTASQMFAKTEKQIADKLGSQERFIVQPLLISADGPERRKAASGFPFFMGEIEASAQREDPERAAMSKFLDKTLGDSGLMNGSRLPATVEAVPSVYDGGYAVALLNLEPVYAAALDLFDGILTPRQEWKNLRLAFRLPAGKSLTALRIVSPDKEADLGAIQPDKTERLTDGRTAVHITIHRLLHWNIIQIGTN